MSRPNPDEPNTARGARIKSARQRVGLDQAGLAELTGVTKKTVSNWETGRYKPHRSIGLLASALGVSEGWIWEGEGTDQNLSRLLEELVRLNSAILDELRLQRLQLIDAQSFPT